MNAAAAGAGAGVLDEPGLGLPRRAENFPLAWLCGPRLRRRRLAVYRFCRLVDDLGDEAHGDREAALDAAEAQLHAATRGEATHPVFAGLAPLLTAGVIGPDPFLRLIEANRWDQRVRRYGSWDELDAYCDLSAAPVGEMVLALSGMATPDRLRLATRACAGLQFANHWQDLAEDARRDRCYVPEPVLRRHGVSVGGLAGTAPGEGYAALLAECLGEARRRLREGWPLVATLRGWLRAEVAGFIACGAAACDAVETAGPDGLLRRASATKAARLGATGVALRAWGRPTPAPRSLDG